MTVFATFDEAGRVTAFYHSALITPPAGSVELTGEAYEDLVLHQEERRLVGGEIVAYEPVPSLDELKAAATAKIDRRASDLLDVGYRTSDGLHIKLDDATRADLGTMATTALAAAGAAVPWPESYKIGWIATENIRIQLPVPADGLALAAAVGDFYARIRQHARTLKDAALAAVDTAALDAIDLEGGWPADD